MRFNFYSQIISNLDVIRGTRAKFCEAYFKYDEQNFTNCDEEVR